MKRPTETTTTGQGSGTSTRLPPLPRLVPLPDGTSVFGPSRSTWYRAAALGQIRMVKIGRSTFLDTESVLAFLDSLPTVIQKPAV